MKGNYKDHQKRRYRAGPGVGVERGLFWELRTWCRSREESGLETKIRNGRRLYTLTDTCKNGVIDKLKVFKIK